MARYIARHVDTSFAGHAPPPFPGRISGVLLFSVEFKLGAAPGTATEVGGDRAALVITVKTTHEALHRTKEYVNLTDARDRLLFWWACRAIRMGQREIDFRSHGYYPREGELSRLDMGSSFEIDLREGGTLLAQNGTSAS